MMFFLANWQRILIAVGILGALGWIGWDRWKLDYYEAWTQHYEAVQRRNGEAIAAQNRAVRKLWAEGKILRERSQSAGVAAQKQVAQAVAAISRPVDLTGKTCDADVMQMWRLVRGVR